MGPQFTCFTGTKVQILTLEASGASVYLLYWYKSTNSDAGGEQGIIHRDMKPQNIMLVENDQQAPFRVIDFGSAVIKGSKPLMDDFTEVYAPPGILTYADIC